MVKGHERQNGRQRRAYRNVLKCTNATERRISMTNSGDIKHGGEMTSYKRSLDLQLVLFSLHFSPYPLRARELGNYFTRRERGGEGSHGDRFGLYRPLRKTPLYREKASISNPFSNFHIFDFSILSSSYRLEYEACKFYWNRTISTLTRQRGNGPLFRRIPSWKSE